MITGGHIFVLCLILLLIYLLFNKSKREKYEYKSHTIDVSWTNGDGTFAIVTKWIVVVVTPDGTKYTAETTSLEDRTDGSTVNLTVNGVVLKPGNNKITIKLLFDDLYGRRNIQFYKYEVEKIIYDDYENIVKIDNFEGCYEGEWTNSGSCSSEGKQLQTRKAAGNCDDLSTERTIDCGPQQQKIQASDKQAGDYFGTSIAISGDGNTAIVGAYQEDAVVGSKTFRAAGAAYIFTWSETSSSWSEEKIQASDKSPLDEFGYSVAISSDGNTVIVGAVEYSGFSSAAYIFTWSETSSSWSEQQKIQASDKQAYDQFGESVAISSDGNTAIVGASHEDTGGGNAGAAYIFTWSETSSSWSEQQKIQASDKQAYDYFGGSVSISGDGNTVIVGARYEDSKFWSESGAAYIFTWSETSSNWSEQQKIQASDNQQGDHFGYSVAISGDGNTAIVGARGEGGTGAAYIFTWSGTSWDEQDIIHASDKQAGDGFGNSVSISEDGNTAIVGANYEDAVVGTNTITDTGAAYIFTRSGTSWTQQNKIRASDKQAYDHFGSFDKNGGVAISGDGNTAIVGASHEDTGGTNAGAAYIYQMQ